MSEEHIALQIDSRKMSKLNNLKRVGQFRVSIVISKHRSFDVPSKNQRQRKLSYFSTTCSTSEPRVLSRVKSHEGATFRAVGKCLNVSSEM